VVVETYCPEHREHFLAEIDDLDPFESDATGSAGQENSS